MRTVAVYPGRFHVFHRGHQAVYDHLVNQYGQENVYIATSAKQNDTDSPFSYEDKVAMMTKMGVPASRIVRVTNTYKKDETAKDLGLDPTTDHLIYALGAKDAERFKYTPESPLQLLSQTKKIKPVSKHAYVEVVPTATFNVLGKAVQSASDIRKMYLDGNENDRQQIIADLYGVADAGLKDMFDQRLGVNAPQEGVIYGQERIFAGDNPVNVMRERREKLMAKITEMREQLARFRQLQLNEQIEEDPDYIEEKWSQKYKRSIDCSNPKGFSQKAHCAGRKKK
jgi:nicotinamide mononucleotide adenylyltransferase